MDDLEEGSAQSGDEAHFRQVMGRFCTGVTVVTGMADGQPAGFTAQSFTSLSLHPPLVTFSPARTVGSWPRIRAAGTFAVNVLSDQQEALSRRFASRGIDKFLGVGWRPGPATGSPLLEGCIAWVEGRVVAEHDGGDHQIVVGRVLDLDTGADARPLLFYRGGYGRFEP